jgi:dTDP-D-glucose 4,6-dehydratase
VRTDCTVLHESKHGFSIIDETGGNEARYWLYSRGMNAFVSRVSTSPDGTYVYSIGRRSQYVNFPVVQLMNALNSAEDHEDTWGGSDTIGGCGRQYRSKLSWEQIRDIIEEFFARRTVE